MTQLGALRILQNLQARVFSTNDAAAALRMGRAPVSQVLRRLAAANYLVQLKRGLWCFKTGVEPLLLPGYLSSPFPCYISLQSALYYHGMISQIPTTIYAVSLGRTRRYNLSVTHVSLHHINIEFFHGYVTDEQTGIKMATPEKALLDVFYLSDTKTRLFFALPEVELPHSFQIKRALKMIDSITSKKKRTLVRARLNSLMSKT